MAWDIISIHYAYCGECTTSAAQDSNEACTRARAIEKAREAGWKVIKGKTLCPKCVALIKNKKA